MIAKTKGIVFHQLKYSETSLIVKIYTRELGLQSYLIKGARSKKSKISLALLQHLSLLEMVASHKEKNQLQYIKEIRSAHQYTSIPYDMTKSSITLFVNELLMKAIREEETNTDLFDYIFQSMQWLDLAGSGFVNFHLVFAIQLTRYLGFYPRGVFSPSTPYFDLEEGGFENRKPVHPNRLHGQEAEKLSMLTGYSFDTIEEVKLNHESRNKLLDQIIHYYQLHLPNFGELKSLDVLRTVLN
jgi:DNA repair protein RecO (recombination protein O)